jgi:hypothetical protein
MIAQPAGEQCIRVQDYTKENGHLQSFSDALVQAAKLSK